MANRKRHEKLTAKDCEKWTDRQLLAIDEQQSAREARIQPTGDRTRRFWEAFERAMARRA
jgi:hypothetical protein